VAVTSIETKPPKAFDLSEFSDFMRKRGYTVDPISGSVKMGPATIYVNQDGTVEGQEPYRTRMEKWVSEYMKT
jgi:hypothetical protein